MANFMNLKHKFKAIKRLVGQYFTWKECWPRKLKFDDLRNTQFFIWFTVFFSLYSPIQTTEGRELSRSHNWLGNFLDYSRKMLVLFLYVPNLSYDLSYSTGFNYFSYPLNYLSEAVRRLYT